MSHLILKILTTCKCMGSTRDVEFFDKQEGEDAAEDVIDETGVGEEEVTFEFEIDDMTQMKSKITRRRRIMNAMMAILQAELSSDHTLA